MNRVFAIVWLVFGTLLCEHTEANITSAIISPGPEFRFEGGAGVSTSLNLNQSWVQIRFEELGTFAVDYVVDSSGVLTLTQDGTIAPPQNFPTQRPTGVFNMSQFEWLGFVASIETLESHEPVSSKPFFLPTTNEVSNYFSQISGLGTERVRLIGGTVPADPTPETMPDAAVLYLNLQVSLPGAGKYRVRQWPSLTAVPEPATFLIASLGATILGMATLRDRSSAN